jgi:hypothetical protein
LPRGVAAGNGKSDDSRPLRTGSQPTTRGKGRCDEGTLSSGARWEEYRAKGNPMSSIDLRQGAQDRIRLFSLSLSDAEAEQLADDRSALARALGIETVDPDRIEVFRTSELEGVGLVSYLVDGAGAVAEQVERDRSRLSALDGWVVVTTPGAFGDAAALNPVPALTLIGEYDDQRPDMTAEPIESEAAQPYTGTPPPTAPVAKRRGGSGTLVIAVAVAVVLLLLWWVLT